MTKYKTVFLVVAVAICTTSLATLKFGKLKEKGIPVSGMIEESDAREIHKALKAYISNLPHNERNKVPSEFQESLLIVHDSLIYEEKSIQIGGWWLEKATTPTKITHWLSMKDSKFRAAVSLNLQKVDSGWKLSDLSFVRAKLR